MVNRVDVDALILALYARFQSISVVEGTNEGYMRLFRRAGNVPLFICR